MKIIFRIVMFAAVFGSGLFFEFWVFGICALCYALLFRGYELLIIGMCIDGLFGSQSYGVSYEYTLIIALELFCVAVVKPYLKFYA